MSDTSSTNAGTGGGSNGPLAVIGLVVVAVLALAYFNRSEPPLERTVSGMAGLVQWLKKNDVDARLFAGSGLLIRDQIGLRILPLYDIDLLSERVPPETKEEVIAQTSENDLQRYVFIEKIKNVPSLVILPKWRTGMRALKAAHADLLIPDDAMHILLDQIGIRGGTVQRDPSGFTASTVQIGGAQHELAALHLQTVAVGSRCEPIIGSSRSMLLGDCQAWGKDRYLLLTDPDILSNHGLALAGNGEVALAIVRAQNPPAAVVLDMSTDIFLVDRDPFAANYERSWEDFARMFEWPFTMIWIGFLAVAGLVFWRAVTRYGPVARIDDEPRAAKTVSIDAKARLLRLANHDAALLRSHVRARLADLAADVLGPQRKASVAPLDLLLPLVSRRDAALAKELEVASDVTGPIGDVLSRLDRFENCHDRIRHELGRTTDAR